MADTVIQPYHGSYLMPSLEHATVADAMHPGILSCEPDATVAEVARLMATHHVHALAVIGISHTEPECLVWAIVGDRDVLRAACADTDETARSLARQPLISVTPRASLREACELMLAERASHLVVVEPESERPVGILSTLDIAGIVGWGEA